MKPAKRKHAVTKHDVITLCGYANYKTKATILHEHDLEEAFPEEDIDITSLRACQAIENGIHNLLIYVARVHAVTQQLFGGRLMKTQEITVRDQNNDSCILVLYDMAVGKMNKSQFYFIKRATTYNYNIQVWGHAMITACPKEEEWDISKPCHEL